ncbi:hypothetical protein C8R44DRAFT_733145 [Mycena epipterygia]|nr:hypothetical protein C8R44DRAFT_733145 [Mycena epipterygia]
MVTNARNTGQQSGGNPSDKKQIVQDTEREARTNFPYMCPMSRHRQIVDEWQAQMDPPQWIPRPCAICGTKMAWQSVLPTFILFKIQQHAQEIHFRDSGRLYRYQGTPGGPYELLSGNFAAVHSQYRADLDRALAHGQQRVQEAQIVAYQTAATLFGRAISYVDLATFEMTTKLEANGTLAPGQTIPLFPVPTPADPLPLPAPYKSLWLLGKTLKGPLQVTNAEEAAGAPESDMLEGEAVIPSEDDGDDDDDD